MSERKIEDIDQMFKKTTKAKLKIDEIPTITKIGSIFDSTLQSQNALHIASSLSKKLDVSLDVLASQDFSEAIKSIVESTQEKILDLVVRAKEYVDSNEIDAKIDTVLSTRINRLLQDFQAPLPDEEKLSGKLITKIKEINVNVLVIGVPLFHGGEDTEAENIGSNVIKLLRTTEITSNFLLVTDRKTELSDSILGFISVNQQPRSIVTLTKRALSLADDKTKIHIVGMVDDRTIETMARADIPDDDPEAFLQLEDVSKRLKTKIQDTLDAITINEEISFGSCTNEIRSGTISSMVQVALDDNKPGLVLVRSVAELAENLDPIAEQITRSVLSMGYPVLIVWD